MIAGYCTAACVFAGSLVRPMGARLNLTHANRIAAELEDEEILRKIALRK